jgi:predicted RNase H-like nuclease (RuvC/YqgF family)
VIAKLVKAQPEKSNRQIAKQAKVDDKTVGAVRRELESTAEIPQLEKTVGADGKARKQPAKKPRKRGKPLPLPERTAEQQDATRRELEAAMAEPDAQIERDRQECVALYQNVKAAEHEQARACLDLAEKLRAAEIKIVGLESEVEELKRENAELRRQLEAKDDGIPDCLRRAPAPSSAS